MEEDGSGDIDEALAEWKDVWFENLKAQIYDLHHRRQLHDEFMVLLEAQEHPDTGIFGDAFRRMYIESQVMAIRRQADDDHPTVSLRRLIGQIEQRRRQFSRSWYVERWVKNFDLASDDERTRLEGATVDTMGTSQRTFRLGESKDAKDTSHHRSANARVLHR